MSCKPPAPPERPFSVRRLAKYRQWAADWDYLPALKRKDPAAYAWLTRFAAEYYNKDNDALRPHKHYERCAKCKAGKPCLYRPHETPLHATNELRRDCYALGNAAERDAYSVGRVLLFPDITTFAPGGPQPVRKNRALAEYSRVEAGDYCDDGPRTAERPFGGSHPYAAIMGHGKNKKRKP